jgi:hypothetical protein
MKEFKEEDIVFLGGSHDGRGPKSSLFFLQREYCEFGTSGLNKCMAGVRFPFRWVQKFQNQCNIYCGMRQFASTERAIIVRRHQCISALKRMQFFYNFVLFINIVSGIRLTPHRYSKVAYVGSFTHWNKSSGTFFYFTFSLLPINIFCKG